MSELGILLRTIRAGRILHGDVVEKNTTRASVGGSVCVVFGTLFGKELFLP